MLNELSVAFDRVVQADDSLDHPVYFVFIHAADSGMDRPLVTFGYVDLAEADGYLEHV